MVNLSACINYAIITALILLLLAINRCEKLRTYIIFGQANVTNVTESYTYLAKINYSSFNTTMQTSLANATRICIVAVLCMVASYTVALGDPSLAVSSHSQRRYTQFPHDQKAHKMDCASCHKFPSDNWQKVRTGDDAFPDITEFPNHASCVNCHRQQFYRGASPAICTICHVAPSPRNGIRRPFPNPREVYDQTPRGRASISDFLIHFSHEKHVDLVASHPVAEASFVRASFRSVKVADESCAVCHKLHNPQLEGDVEFATPPPKNIGDNYWIKKGTFMASPIGHSSCFTCHSADTGIEPAPSNCAVCHQYKPKMPASDVTTSFISLMRTQDRVSLIAWGRRNSAGTFRHEFPSHAEMSCSSCHEVTKLNSADPFTRRVPISSCAMCHATPTSDDGGVLNYEMDMRAADPKFSCVKCHLAFGQLPIPASHTAAIKEASGK
jgi:hypothetical protein